MRPAMTVRVSFILGSGTLEPLMRGLSFAIGYDPQVWRRDLEPLAGQSCRLVMLPPLVSLPCPIPGDQAAVEIPKQNS
jgi:hypothetical protein